MGELSDGIRGHLRGEGECGEKEGRWGREGLGGVERGRGSRKVAREEECIVCVGTDVFLF